MNAFTNDTAVPQSRRPSQHAWLKPIPQARDRKQSEVLTGAVGMVLFVKAVLEIVALHGAGAFPEWFWLSLGFSVAFAGIVWLLRSATAPAAAMGGLICMHVLLRQMLGVHWRQTAMPALLALFILTFAATRFGRSRKESLGVAEGRRGRRASQVLANLGIAGIFAAGGTSGSYVSTLMLAACIAALAEATADTVSSEMGQALAGTRWGATLLITTGAVVPPGTDGGVSIAGTACGAISAAVIVLVSPFAHIVVPAVCIFAGACAGLLFDSILGATLERKGWLGNDLVNFLSTLFAAAVACGAIRLL
jgi:uncharacterized protein (TIGR00297 family)